MANIKKKNMARPIIPPRLVTEDKSVVMSILMAGMVLRSFRGLKSLTDLRAFMLEFPLYPLTISGRRSLAIDASTTKKSSQFHWSVR